MTQPERSNDDRWFGVGTSSHCDATTAGSDAAAHALLGDDPKLVLVFCAPDLDLQRVIDGVCALAPGVPMIGCSTAGEISSGLASDQSVTVSILGGAFDVVTTCAPQASEDLFLAGRNAASAVDSLPKKEHRLLVLLSDGLAGDQQEVVRGAYAEVGAAVPLVGGCAGDGGVMAKTFQVFDGKVVEDCVVAAAVASSGPVGIGVRHGWERVGEPMLVSESDGTTVFELDGARALDVYLDRAAASPGLANDEQAFKEFAMTHPLGLLGRSSEEVRFITGADLKSGAITSIAKIPQGSLVWLMEGDADSVLKGTSESCNEALAALDGHEPIGLLMFDCIARRSVLGHSGVAAEMATVGEALPNVPVAGFYTYGEIARTQGVRGFHNQTLVTLALS